MVPLTLPPKKFMRPKCYFQLHDIQKHAVGISPDGITIISSYMIQNLEGGYTHHGNPMNIDLLVLSSEGESRQRVGELVPTYVCIDYMALWNNLEVCALAPEVGGSKSDI